MKNRKIDKLAIVIFVILLGSVAILNLFQTDRPTVSETENRNLATMPEFTWDAFLSGKYFSEIDEFISDTFYGREYLVSLAKKMDLLKSLSLIYERDFTIIGPSVDTGNIGEDATFEEFTLPPLPDLTTEETTDDTSAPETSDEVSSDITDDTSSPETDEETSEEITQPPEPPVTPILLSSSSATFTEGATFVLTATVGKGYGELTWTVSKGSEFVSITDNKDGTATVKGNKKGEATVNATVSKNGESFSAECTVTINAVAIQTGEGAVFLPSGLFLYNNAAYTQSWYNSSASKQLASVYERYAILFPETRMNVVIAPLATITIKDPKVLAKINDEKVVLDRIAATITGNVNFVNLKNTFVEHSNEYLFFKSDHHWTHRGAYYAYADFMRSIGETPVPIDLFEKKILSSSYNGSMYNFTKDERVKNYIDTVEAYFPSKSCTMQILNQYGNQSKYNYCINPYGKNYLAFINGDYPYTVINVPENPQDKSILVIKDSYGNAFVPYLTEHYGNIFVIDPRYVDMNIVEQFKDYGLSDIVFIVNTASAANAVWTKYLIKLIS